MTAIQTAPSALTLVSSHLAVRLSVDGGLRIAGLARAGCDENILGVFPDVVWDTPWGPYRFVGGHRLWVAPERQPEVCEPEPAGVAEVEGPTKARLTHLTPSPSGLVKTIEVELAETGPALVVRHAVKNEGATSVELAPWALTMLELGGVAIIPHDPSPVDGAIYTPTRLLVGWPYTSFTDERLTLTPELLRWRAEAGPAWKVGTFSNVGRVAYARGDVMFEKQFAPAHGETHTDRGCNVELYSNDRFVELETLGPLTTLEPGASTVHQERWLVQTIQNGARA